MGQQIGSFFKSKYTGQQIENMLDSATNIADQYDPASSYVVGDLVLYNNGLYVCTGATTGTFDPTKWTATSLFAVLSGLASSYTDPNSDGNVVIGADSTVGEKILRSLTFPGLTNRYYLPFAQYIRERLQNDPSSASFSIEIPDAEEAPMHSTVIKGKTSAINQLIGNGDFSNGTTNWSVFLATQSVTDKVNTITVTNASDYPRIYRTIPVVVGHVYFAHAYMKPSYTGRVFCCNAIIDASQNVWNECGAFLTATTTSQQVGFGAVGADVQVNDTVQIKNCTFLDLTTIFSAADLATIGTSVDTFKTVFLKRKGYPFPQYIANNAGSLQNVNGTYRLRGRNLWDEEWEVGSINSTTGQNASSTTRIRSKNYTAVDENARYYYKTAGTGVYVYEYDAEKNYITRFSITDGISTLHAGTRYIRLLMTDAYGTTYKSDICINISDASINGQYFPSYNGGTIDLSSAPLNGFDDTVCDVKDYATGERITRFPLVDLGTLTWNINHHATFGDYFYASVSSLGIAYKGSYSSVAFNILTGRYQTVPRYAAAFVDKTICCDGGTNSVTQIQIKDSAYSDAATFKTAMSGVMLGYEAATPTTSIETPQPVETQYGYNAFEPVSGGVQSAEVDAVYYENIAGYIDKKLAEG